MSHPEDKAESYSRRRFLKTSLAGTVIAAAGPLATDAARPTTSTVPLEQKETSTAKGPLPMRVLGKTGVKVTMLNIGGMPEAFTPRYLDVAWDHGLRYIDTADCYLGGKSERNVAKWLERRPDRRKDLFLVTKDHPKEGPRQLLDQIDTRLEHCGTDYIDLFFIHGLETRDYGQHANEWPKSTELKEVAEQLKKSGKIRFFGFSTHSSDAPQQLMAAAEGGFIDAIMVRYSPFLPPSDELNRSLDACHKAGIGLISMKEMKAHSLIPKRIPEFDKLGLTSHQALLHAVWSDERIATICSGMENLDQVRENCEAARLYKEPLTFAQIAVLREVAMASGPTMCPNCDGRCKHAAGQHDLALDDIARFVTYYERDGRVQAGEFYRALPEAHRLAKNADLKAAREACLCKLDFARILKKAERYFA